MTTVPAITIEEQAQDDVGSGEFGQSWADLKTNSDIQFAPVDIPEKETREPGWLDDAFRWLADVLGDLFGWFPSAWPIVKWVLIIAAVLLVLYIIFRLIEPFLQTKSADETYIAAQMEWQPDAQQSAALLEDADKLAAQGKYAEATHLLLQRSVTHLSEAKPDWVEPSSTARELAAISALPEKARETFGVIAERVELSLFALRQLNREDWEAARAAYADFAALSLRVNAS